MHSVVFDVVGTIFSYDQGAHGVETRLGDKLKALGVSSKLLFYAWVCSTERDYSYLSQIGQYRPFITILEHTFIRALYNAGVPEPETFCTKEDVSYIISEFRKLKPRPGAAEMISILREGGFEVRCCSDANVERLKGYFDAAGIDMPLEHIYSADEVSAGKPEAAVYKMARGKVGADEKGAVSIFAAAHAWDIAAAKAAGFDTAYCTIYERDPCEAIFGKADLTSETLVGMAQGIVERWGKK